MSEKKELSRLGIFDSGIGGLTILKQLLPLGFEEIIYLQDRKNLPYGNKSPEFIAQATKESITFLQKHNIDAIIIACHTACCYALESLQKAHKQIPIVGIVDLVTTSALKATKNGRIGIMATTATINSHRHASILLKFDPLVSVFEQACPKLVPLIEEHPRNDFYLNQAVEEYCKPFLINGIDTLILGCTHYEDIADTIKLYLNKDVHIISADKYIAQKIQNEFVLKKANAKTKILFIETSAEGYKVSDTGPMREELLVD
jgi:glutamate racemase